MENIRMLCRSSKQVSPIRHDLHELSVTNVTMSCQGVTCCAGAAFLCVQAFPVTLFPTLFAEQQEL